MNFQIHIIGKMSIPRNAKEARAASSLEVKADALKALIKKACKIHGWNETLAVFILQTNYLV